MTIPTMNIGYLYRQFNIPLVFMANLFDCTENWMSTRKKEGDSLTPKEFKQVREALHELHIEREKHFTDTFEKYYFELTGEHKMFNQLLKDSDFTEELKKIFSDSVLARYTKAETNVFNAWLTPTIADKRLLTQAKYIGLSREWSIIINILQKGKLK